MNQIEDQIASTLHDKALDGIDVADLLAASRRRGQRYLKRRRAWQACGSVAAVAVAVAGTAAVVPHVRGNGGPDNTAGGYPAATIPSRHAQPSPGPVTTPSQTGGALTSFRPPPATGARSAATDPRVVGAEPGLLHFDIPSSALPTPVTSAQWSSADGLERLDLSVGARGTAATGVIWVQVSRDRSLLEPLGGSAHTVNVGSRPATVTSESFEGHLSSQLRWQPLSGVWAEVHLTGDQASAVQLAEAMTFDHVLRCAVPFRLSWVPAGTTLEGCNVVFDATGPSGTASVHVGNSTVTVTLERGWPMPSASPTTIAGKPAADREYPSDGGHQILQVDVDYGDHIADVLAEGHYDKSTVLRIAAGYRDVPGSDPSQWPASPLG